MMRHSMIISVFVTAVLFGLQPATVWAQDQPKSELETKKILERLDGRLDGIDKQLKDVLKVKAEVNDLRDKINRTESSNLNHGIDLKEVMARLKSLETKVNDLADDLRFLKRIVSGESASGVTTRSSPQPAVLTSRVLLENNSGEEMIFVLNQRSYPVPANKTATVTDVPLGALTYQVVSPSAGAVLRANTTVVTATETLTLRANRPGF